MKKVQKMGFIAVLFVAILCFGFFSYAAQNDVDSFTTENDDQMSIYEECYSDGSCPPGFYPCCNAFISDWDCECIPDGHSKNCKAGGEGAIRCSYSHCD